ncbi:MAG: hypothetical protein ABII76_13720, partial [Pseudomonadota bacterium]
RTMSAHYPVTEIALKLKALGFSSASHWRGISRPRVQGGRRKIALGSTLADASHQNSAGVAPAPHTHGQKRWKNHLPRPNRNGAPRAIGF